MEPKKIGAHCRNGGVEFRVWAPKAQKVEVLLPARVPLQAEDKGYFSAFIGDLQPGQKYRFRVDDQEPLPDPASRFQPEGVHGPSQVVAAEFPWSDEAWRGIPFDELVIYELHVGTFTAEGSFAAVKNHLDRLQALGVTALELMPVAQFPGKRNWGYDGVHPFAPQNSYGKNSPEDLKSLVNECHRRGLAVILDVVYNHLGPEGNHLAQWGPYFQNKYQTPWGDALNFDGAGSDEVRYYFLENMRQWIEEYHFDGLRLDAIHAILDTSASPFLAEAADLVQKLRKKWQREIWLIAESDGNDPRVLRSTKDGGYGFDAQWSDDLHHGLHAFLTREHQGYYADYGSWTQLQEIFKKGTLYRGQYSAFRQRRHGQPYAPEQRKHLVVCTQNHDQIGNRARGERLATLVEEKKLRAATAGMFLFGGLPLIFMGEEIGEKNPFCYFVDPIAAEILQAVREGRKKEFAAFGWGDEIPDPGQERTFAISRPEWSQLGQLRAQEFTELYQKLIAISKTIRQRKIWEHPELEINNLEESILQITTPNFEALISFQEQPQTVFRVRKDLPLQYSLGTVMVDTEKIHLPPWAVAVFYE